MSMVTIQIGQCGNQIGYDFFYALATECLNRNGCKTSKKYIAFDEQSSDLFFDFNKNGHTARSVLVDTESKVINRINGNADQLKLWSYDKKCQISHKVGSGNNWAQGFYFFGPKIEEQFEEATRRQVEKCDRLCGFLSFMSLAGGTGSGVGSYLTRLLRDHYQNSFILNQVIWPYSSGEIAVQSYNSMLSLAHIYQSVDSIITFNNDMLHKICSQQLNLSKVSLCDINKVICKQLIHALLPSSAFNDHSLSSFDCLGDYIRQLTPHPDYKMTSLMMSPFITDQIQEYTIYHWPALLKDLGQKLLYRTNSNASGSEWQLKYGGNMNSSRAFAHMLIARGLSGQDELDETIIKSQYLKFKMTYPVYQFNGFSLRYNSKPVFNMEKSAVMAVNDACQMSHIDEVYEKAWKLFSCHAYLHQYKKHGSNVEDFIDSFATVEQMLSNYAKL